MYKSIFKSHLKHAEVLFMAVCIFLLISTIFACDKDPGKVDISVEPQPPVLEHNIEIDAIQAVLNDCGVSDVDIIDLDILSLAIPMDYTENQPVTIEGFINTGNNAMHFHWLNELGERVHRSIIVSNQPNDTSPATIDLVRVTGTITELSPPKDSKFGSSGATITYYRDEIEATSFEIIKDNIYDKTIEIVHAHWDALGQRLQEVTGLKPSTDCNLGIPSYLPETEEIILCCNLIGETDIPRMAPFILGVYYFVSIDGVINKIRIIERSPSPTDSETKNWSESEATEISLVLSGEILPPEGLYRKVLDDLSKIRETYGNDIPSLRSVHSRLPWASGEILVGMDNEMAQAVADEKYHHWDELNEKYHLESIDDITDFGNLHSLKFEEDYNPKYLTEAYFKLPGITFAGPNHTIGDGPCIYACRDDGSIAYLFRYAWGDCPSGCMNSRYWYFDFDEDEQPVLSGHFDPQIDCASGSIRDCDMPDWWIEAKLCIEEYDDLSYVTGLYDQE